ncbi:helix-turn-helix domain-containing protein [Staphylococcus coagulans]|uniref:helix-turn-helix domain-containing protein n=1 Tax=Staphylococcus coagulans TaxID=74706 RepID=UPI0033652D16
MIVCTLNKMMREHNKTQSEIAEKTGITRPTLLSLIRNENKSIKYETIERLCDYFQITMYDLLLYYPKTIDLDCFDIFLLEPEPEKYYITIRFNINGVKVIFEESFTREEMEFSNRFKRIDLFATVDYETLENIRKFNVISIFQELMYMHELFIEYQHTIYEVFHDGIGTYEKYPYKIDLIPIAKEKSAYEKIVENIDKLSEQERKEIIEFIKNKELN